MKIFIAEYPWGNVREMQEGDELHHHSSKQCAGEICTIHNPTDHHMRDWDQCWRLDRSPVIIERLCPDERIGHPDPDQREFLKKIGKVSHLIHGCDGCCKAEN